MKIPVMLIRNVWVAHNLFASLLYNSALLSGQVCHQAYLHGYDSAKKWIWTASIWEQIFISISRYNYCFQRGKVLKDVISRIYEHIPSQPDYFRIHFFHLAAQEFGIKNGIIKGKGKALATQGKFSKSTPYMERLFTETERLNQTLFVIHFELKQIKKAFQQEQQSTNQTNSFPLWPHKLFQWYKFAPDTSMQWGPVFLKSFKLTSNLWYKLFNVEMLFDVSKSCQF